MMNAIATWDRREKSWSVDCPHCGRSNYFTLEKPDIPDGFDEMKDKLSVDLDCHSCRSETKVWVMVRSRKRSKK